MADAPRFDLFSILESQDIVSSKAKGFFDTAKQSDSGAAKTVEKALRVDHTERTAGELGEAVVDRYAEILDVKSQQAYESLYSPSSITQVRSLYKVAVGYKVTGGASDSSGQGSERAGKNVAFLRVQHYTDALPNPFATFVSLQADSKIKLLHEQYLEALGDGDLPEELEDKKNFIRFIGKAMQAQILSLYPHAELPNNARHAAPGDIVKVKIVGNSINPRFDIESLVTDPDILNALPRVFRAQDFQASSNNFNECIGELAMAIEGETTYFPEFGVPDVTFGGN